VIALTEAEARRIDVFFYGLFMDDAVLREKGINPANRRMASVENFSLVVGARATLVPGPGRTVYGVLFSLTQTEVGTLYGEASVSAYRPEAVSAQLADGSVTPALCFNLPVPPSMTERNPRYVSKLRELAERIWLAAELRLRHRVEGADPTGLETIDPVRSWMLNIREGGERETGSIFV
jgi:hypothetical protein